MSSSTAESDFIWQEQFGATHEATPHSYPPDAAFDLPWQFTFSRVLGLFVVLVATIDFLLVGYADTKIPYNYPFFVGVCYLLGAIWVLRRIFTLLDKVKIELVDITARTTADDALYDRKNDITPAEIEAGIESTLDRYFHPAFLLGGALVGGTFAIVVMWLLGVLDEYPYLLLNFAYGAGHGLFYGPLIATAYLVYKISNYYIVDIDIMDPDGMGGYQQIGDSIISLIIYGIILTTVDFIILSSVSFMENTLFLTAVFVLYGLMLSSFFALAVVGVFWIRRRLLDIRAEKTGVMREQFTEVEARFWAKQQRNVDPQPEADTIQTMQVMFDQMHGMELWPINLVSLARLVGSGASSLFIAAYKAGHIPIPRLIQDLIPI